MYLKRNVTSFLRTGTSGTGKVRNSAPADVCSRTGTLARESKATGLLQTARPPFGAAVDRETVLSPVRS